METIDVAIILLAFWALFHGWKQGLVKEITSMVGFFVGLFLAYRVYISFGEYLAPALTNGDGTSTFFIKAIVFIIVWAVVPILLGVAANIVTRSLKGLHLGVFNSTAGALISLLKYFILMSFIFSAMNYVGFMSKEKKDASRFYQPIASLVENIFAGQEIPIPIKSKTQDKTDTIWINVHHKK